MLELRRERRLVLAKGVSPDRGVLRDRPVEAPLVGQRREVRRGGVVGPAQRDSGLVGDRDEVMQLDHIADRPRGDRRGHRSQQREHRAGTAPGAATDGRRCTERESDREHERVLMGQRRQPGEHPGRRNPRPDLPPGAAAPGRTQRRPDRGQLKHDQQVLGDDRAGQLDQHRVDRGQRQRRQRDRAAERLQRDQPQQPDGDRAEHRAAEPDTQPRRGVPGVPVDQIDEADEVGVGGREIGGRAVAATGAGVVSAAGVVIAVPGDHRSEPVVGARIVDRVKRGRLDVADAQRQREQQQRAHEQRSAAPGVDPGLGRGLDGRAQQRPTIPAIT